MRAVEPAVPDISLRRAAGDGAEAGVAMPATGVVTVPVPVISAVMADAAVPGVVAAGPSAMFWSSFPVTGRRLDAWVESDAVEVDARRVDEAGGARDAADSPSTRSVSGSGARDRGPVVAVAAVRLGLAPPNPVCADPTPDVLPGFSRSGEPTDCGPGSASGLSAEATAAACGPASDKPSANAAAPIRVPRLVIEPPLPKSLLALAALAGSVRRYHRIAALKSHDLRYFFASI